MQKCSKNIHTYEYLDTDPGPGIFYYRLKSILKDGTQNFSNMVVLSRQTKEEIHVVLYPNPSKGMFNVSFDSEINGEMNFDIQNVIGQSLQKGYLAVQEGLNTLEFSVKDFAAATYIISMTINGQRIQRKLIKQ